MASSHDYISRKVHSLLGVIPIGIFLILHFVVNHYAVHGATSFNKASDVLESLPFLIWIEWVVIYLPLIFHGIYGIYIAFQGTVNVGNHRYFRNWMYILQRFTGLFLVIFIAWHVWQTKIAMLRGTPLNFDMMADILSNPFFLVFYIVGVLSAVFHLCNGLWSFLVTWGITITPRSQVVSTYVMVVIFILMSWVGIRAVLAFTNPDLAIL